LQHHESELLTNEVALCLYLNAYWCPAALNYPSAGAAKKCTSQASTHCRNKVTRISAFTIVRCVTMKCGLLFGPRTDSNPPQLAASFMRG
jgi:hypothetical protein